MALSRENKELETTTDKVNDSKESLNASDIGAILKVIFPTLTETQRYIAISDVDLEDLKTLIAKIKMKANERLRPVAPYKPFDLVTDIKHEIKDDPIQLPNHVLLLNLPTSDRCQISLLGKSIQKKSFVVNLCRAINPDPKDYASTSFDSVSGLRIHILDTSAQKRFVSGAFFEGAHMIFCFGEITSELITGAIGHILPAATLEIIYEECVGGTNVKLEETNFNDIFCEGLKNYATKGANLKTICDGIAIEALRVGKLIKAYRESIHLIGPLTIFPPRIR